MEDFFSSSITQFEYYKLLAERTFEQLSDQQLFEEPADGSNSIGVIVKHLKGNMVSRWTDFLTTDGEKEWRNRADEFTNDLVLRSELIKQWDEGWKVLFDALHSIKDDDLDKNIYIYKKEYSVGEAVIKQLAHTVYHVGQIVYLGKMLKGNDWEILSVPRQANH